MPDSSKSCGDWKAPAERMTARRAAIVSSVPPRRQTTPVARRPDSATRRARVPVAISRLGRLRASGGR